VGEAEAEVARLKGETYCAYCGDRFPLDAPDSCEQIGNHIQVCPKHPMRVVEEKYEEVRATMRRMDVSAVESRTERNSLRVRVAELGAEVERLREEIKTAHADGASALVASFENTDPKARVCELEAEVDRLKQATARAYPDSVAQIVEGIKVYPQSTNGELEAEVGRIRKEPTVAQVRAEMVGKIIAMINECYAAQDRGFNPIRAEHVIALNRALEVVRWADVERLKANPMPTDYDRSIHANPDAHAWAKLFCETFPGSDEGLMIGWFANAMMAMHDHIKQTDLVVKEEPIKKEHGNED
jgi:hypothetical protein